MKRRKAFVKEEREIQIINHAYQEFGETVDYSITAARVANWLDIGATQARTLLKGLVAQNVLYAVEYPYPGVCGKVVVYRFTAEYISDVENKCFRATPKPKRNIKINTAQGSFVEAIQ